MARAWIELDGDQAGWGPTRVVVAKLSRDGYIVQVLTGSGPTPRGARLDCQTSASPATAKVTSMVAALAPAERSR